MTKIELSRVSKITWFLWLGSLFSLLTIGYYFIFGAVLRLLPCPHMPGTGCLVGPNILINGVPFFEVMSAIFSFSLFSFLDRSNDLFRKLTEMPKR